MVIVRWFIKNKRHTNDIGNFFLELNCKRKKVYKRQVVLVGRLRNLLLVENNKKRSFQVQVQEPSKENGIEEAIYMHDRNVFIRASKPENCPNAPSSWKSANWNIKQSLFWNKIANKPNWNALINHHEFTDKMTVDSLLSKFCALYCIQHVIFFW